MTAVWKAMKGQDSFTDLQLHLLKYLEFHLRTRNFKAQSPDPFDFLFSRVYGFLNFDRVPGFYWIASRSWFSSFMKTEDRVRLIDRAENE